MVLIHVDSALVSLCGVDSVSDVSEVHVASMLKVDVRCV
jgi:hypothetical protein